MKLILNIFIIYIAILLCLPALPYCDEVYDYQSEKTNSYLGAEHSDNNNKLCSPFCGEDECGIVINFEVDIPPPKSLPFIEIVRIVSFENLLIRFGLIQWPPP